MTLYYALTYSLDCENLTGQDWEAVLHRFGISATPLALVSLDLPPSGPGYTGGGPVPNWIGNKQELKKIERGAIPQSKGNML
ncbi:hypothetical protein Tco_1062539 [Tanacetum coccineum]